MTGPDAGATGPGSWPTREQVDRRWRQVLEGRVGREEAHDWAARWVESDLPHPEDLVLGSGLQHLHGVDERSRGGGAGPGYARSLASVERLLVEWRDECEDYDRDLEGCVAEKRAEALRLLTEEERGAR
ncbi:hypothetical protein [Kineococcus sp. SYSU DK002]|uniref:hypothetical protein n=1 Tax=Kineococcus sp. SYSU DK002 TaxID=3383123 RepID=UPI003D7D0532